MHTNTHAREHTVTHTNRWGCPTWKPPTYIYTYICTHTYMDRQTNTYARTHAHAHIYTYMGTNAHVDVDAHMDARPQTNI